LRSLRKNNYMNKKIIILVVAVIIIVVVGIVWWQSKSIPKYTGPIEKITVGVEKSLLPSLVWVAENKGYFQENGTEVTIKEFDSGRAAFTSMLDKGGLDMVTVAQTPIMFNSFTRSDFAITAGMVSSYNDVFVLARTDRGITKPGDLRGKKIGVTKGSTGHYFLGLFGVTKGSTGHYFLGLFLDTNNIQFSDVEIVDLPTGQLTQNIAAGAVDAISTWQPNIYNAQKSLGAKSITFPNNKIFREDFYFVTNQQFLQNHPEAIIRFLEAIKQAEDFIQNNRDQAVAIVSQRLGIDKNFVSSVWNDFQLRLFMDQTIIQVIEDEARWAIQNKLTNKTEVPNYLDYIYLDALQKVKPEAVTIIK